jgi:hypothetical protein
MVKANNLIKEQKERIDRKEITFSKILAIIEKKIVISSSGNYYYTWYTIPQFIVGLPMYCLKECRNYIITNLKKDGFEIEIFDPNILLISWFPK